MTREHARVFRVTLKGPKWAWTHWCGFGRVAAPGRYWKWRDAFAAAREHAERCCR